jgi:coiled-coil domain-containing protein 55
MSLKFGLNIRKQGPTAPRKPAPRKAAFGDDDSDEEQQDKPNNATKPIASFGTASGPPKLKTKNAGQSNQADLSNMRSIKKIQAEAEQLDPSIYDYDAAYDAIHAKTAAKKAEEQQDALERKPKYMGNLLAAAEVRKRDQLRAQDRLLQKQREAEGEEFVDKDAFVTEAYKKQQEEVKRMEEEEAKKEEEEAKKRQGKGMSGFYRNVMEQEDQKHKEIVEAAANVKPGEVVVDAEPQEKSAADLAKELNERGAKILINDEGQVADKRQLLTAGLNVAPKRKLDGSSASAATAQRPIQQQAFRGPSDAKRAMHARQTAMMQEQLEAAAKKAAEEEEQERLKIERAAKSRKTESDVSSARERYLQRKKEAEAVKARGEA